MLDDRRQSRVHVRHVCGEATRQLGRPNADEVDLRVGDLGGVGRESEPPVVDVAAQEFVEAGLVDG